MLIPFRTIVKLFWPSLLLIGLIYALRPPVHKYNGGKLEKMAPSRLMEVGGIARTSEDILRAHDAALDVIPVEEDPLPAVHMVYMYVNGSDPAVATARERYGGTKSANSRDRDNGEMRYSLRSLDKFAPWFRGDIIILLGDDAPPRWLNTTHPRVKIVRHSSYFKNPEALPTFNSDAIQMNMHRISGLGPVLINWCDDYFLGRPVRPSDWIRNGKTVVYQEPNTIRGGRKDFERLKASNGNKWEGKIYHTKALVEERFPEATKHVRFNFAKHAPHPMSLPLLRDMADVWPTEYNVTSYSRFRTYETVDITVLYQSYCQIRGECIIDDQRITDDAATLQVLRGNDFENIRELLRMFVKRPPKFFTFNDDWGEQDPVSSKFIFGEFLATLFPNPSQYELPTVRECTECE